MTPGSTTDAAAANLDPAASLWNYGPAKPDDGEKKA